MLFGRSNERQFVHPFFFEILILYKPVDCSQLKQTLSRQAVELTPTDIYINSLLTKAYRDREKGYKRRVEKFFLAGKGVVEIQNSNVTAKVLVLSCQSHFYFR